MKLFEALKKIQLLAGEIAQLESVVKENASWQVQRRVTDQGELLNFKNAEINAVAVYATLTSKKEEMCILKGEVAKANAPIQEKLARLGESKGTAKLLDELITRRPNGRRLDSREAGAGLGEKPVLVDFVVSYDHAFPLADLEKQLQETRAKIQTLEAEINAHNFTTNID